MMGCGFNFTLISSKTETLFTPFSYPVLDTSDIESNPVKAGLVKSPEQWPFSSARFRDEYNRLKPPPKPVTP
jgi:hypothetical protein